MTDKNTELAEFQAQFPNLVAYEKEHEVSLTRYMGQYNLFDLDEAAKAAMENGAYVKLYNRNTGQFFEVRK